MPLLEDLEFTQSGLSITYRGSVQPQALTLHLRAAGSNPSPFGPRFIITLIDAINAGAAGSNHFSPAEGAAELVSGSTDFPAPGGPDFTWVLRVKGVSPLFLRNVVETLRLAGGIDNPLQGMTIFGSLPPDGTALSAREAQVRAWLDDPLAYVQQWPDPGFPVSFREAFGAAVRVRVAGEIHGPIEKALRTVCLGWLAATYNYVNQYGEPILDQPDRLSRLLPKFGATRRELRAYFEEFTRTAGPARAVLVNLLTRFHLTVMPIEEAEIAL